MRSIYSLLLLALATSATVNESPTEDLELIETDIQPRLLYEDPNVVIEPTVTDQPLLLLQSAPTRYNRPPPQVYHSPPYVLPSREPEENVHLAYAPSTYPLTSYVPKKVAQEDTRLASYQPRLPIKPPATLYSLQPEEPPKLSYPPLHHLQPAQPYQPPPVTPSKPATGLLPILQPRIVNPTPSPQPNPYHGAAPQSYLAKPRIHTPVYPVNQQYTRPQSYTRPQQPQPISYYPLPSAPLRQSSSSSSNIPRPTAVQLPSAPYTRPNTPYTPPPPLHKYPVSSSNSLSINRSPVPYTPSIVGGHRGQQVPVSSNPKGLAYSPSNYYPSHPQPSPSVYPSSSSHPQAHPLPQVQPGPVNSPPQRVVNRPSYPSPPSLPSYPQTNEPKLYPPPAPYIRPQGVPPIVANRPNVPYSS